MTSVDKAKEALQYIFFSTQRLRSLSFTSSDVKSLLETAAIITFREQFGSNRPMLIGFIGCTGTGKSTLFNSLAGGDVSLTGWKTHNTCGPVLLAHEEFWNALKDKENQWGKMFMPDLPSECVSERTQAAGSPKSLQWINTSHPFFKTRALLDLPDINTTLSYEEEQISIRLLPWLDIVVFMVDDETIYHRIYESCAEHANTLKQARMCALNNRGTDKIDLEHRDFKDAMKFYGVDTIHVLPQIQRASHFTNEPAYLDFQHQLQNIQHFAPVDPLIKMCVPHVKTILEENQQRMDALENLKHFFKNEVRAALSHEPPVDMKSILHDDVLQVLQHLGLKRFSLTNILHFLKKVVKTGALRNQFRIAFGSERDQLLSNILRLDSAKLKSELNRRLADHNEKLRYALLNHTQYTTLSSMIHNSRWLVEFQTTVPDDPLNKAVQSFEDRCRSILTSDKLNTSVVNDPLLAIGLILALITDIMTIPGFGSWALAPTVFRYIPLGPFDQAKREFQRDLHEIIHHALMNGLTEFDRIINDYVLLDTDPLYLSLKDCSQYHET